MEFPFQLCRLLPQRISGLDQSLRAPRPDLQQQMMTMVDELGKASAKAQHLPAPITSTAKMQSTNHHLYILRDCTPNNSGKGVVIGFLKVGYKKLFVLDRHGAHHEEEVLCVLDFYVHESLQRHGHGKELFEHMLQQERVDPQQLAVDRPSEKFLCFLRKHYDLRSTIPQVNNFVVFDGFFRDRNAPVRKLPPKRRPEGEIKPYSLSEREFLKEEVGLPWPFNQSGSLSRSNSVGCSPSKGGPRPPLSNQELLKNLQICCPHPPQGEMNGEPCDAAGPRRRTSGSNSQQGLVAYRNSYSRYGNLDSRMAPPGDSAGWGERDAGAGDGLPEIPSKTMDPEQRGKAPEKLKGVEQPPPQTVVTLPPLSLRGLSAQEGARPYSKLQAEPPDPPRLDKPHIGEHVEKALGVGSRGATPQRRNHGNLTSSDLSDLVRQNNSKLVVPPRGEIPPPAHGAGPKRLPYHPAGEERHRKEQLPPLGYLKTDQPALKHEWSYRPSWTVFGAANDAQWMRHKQEYRSTRPW